MDILGQSGICLGNYNPREAQGGNPLNVNMIYLCIQIVF